MKNNLLIAASLLLIIGMTSCEKTYTCNCTTTNSFVSSNPEYDSYFSYYGGGNTTSSTSFNGKKKKRESEDWCKGYETSASSSFSETFDIYDENDTSYYYYGTVIGTETVTFTYSENTVCSL